MAVSHGDVILTLNAGSSSIKFALFSNATELQEIARGQIERIGGEASFKLETADGRRQSRDVAAQSHDAAAEIILGELHSILDGREVGGVGHRITHGGPDFDAPRVLDPPTLKRLEGFAAWAPLHQPYNLAAVAGAQNAFPDALQVGCFDTAFHRGHPWVSDAFALPREYYDKGVRRYGFHGLSYAFVSEELARRFPSIACGKVVVAHLGNGASMCALDGGRSVASTMGFTALDGLAMGTRCGQIDPGVLLYLIDEEGMSSKELSTLLYRQSGLKGLSGLSSDMRELEADDRVEARQAIDYFIHRIRREIGALAADLGGLDALVFCGGIGENSPAVRAGVCREMDCFGIAVDETANAANAVNIGNGRTAVLIVPTDEERVIAKAVFGCLAH